MGGYWQQLADSHDWTLKRVRGDSDVERRTEACRYANCDAVRRRVITFAYGEAVTDTFYTDPGPLTYCPGAGGRGSFGSDPAGGRGRGGFGLRAVRALDLAPLPRRPREDGCACFPFYRVAPVGLG